MGTLLARILRFGWLGSVILALVAVAAFAVAITVPVVGSLLPATATTAARQPASVTVSVTTTTRIVPTDLSHRPAANHQFIAVAVQLTNAGSRAAAFSVADFALREQSGTSFDPDPAAADLLGTAALPVQGTLQPGARRSGEIVFQAPISDHTAMLLWQPSGAAATGSSASWTINI